MKKSEKSTTNNFEKITRNVKSSALKYSILELLKKASPKQDKRKRRKIRGKIKEKRGGC